MTNVNKWEDKLIPKMALSLSEKQHILLDSVEEYIPTAVEFFGEALNKRIEEDQKKIYEQWKKKKSAWYDPWSLLTSLTLYDFLRTLIDKRNQKSRAPIKLATGRLGPILQGNSASLSWSGGLKSLEKLKKNKKAFFDRAIAERRKKIRQMIEEEDAQIDLNDSAVRKPIIVELLKEYINETDFNTRNYNDIKKKIIETLDVKKEERETLQKDLKETDEEMNNYKLLKDKFSPRMVKKLAPIVGKLKRSINNIDFTIINDQEKAMITNSLRHHDHSFQMSIRRPKITLAELKKLATKHKIKGRSKMNKAQLEKALSHRVKSVKKKSRKPVKKKSRKPVKKKSRKPVKKKSRKPVKKKSRKHVKKKSRKHVKKKSRKRKSKFKVRKDRIFEKHGLLGDDKKIRKQKVLTAQQEAYKKLSFDAKKEILRNPGKYPVYAPIIAKVRREMMEVLFASTIRPKLKLTTGWSIPRVAQFGDEWSPLPKGLKLINILQAIYDHIISYPPYPNHSVEDSDDGDVNYTINAWADFSNTNYPEYDRFINKVIKWPKFMFLIYYTYKVSYIKYYNLEPELQIKDYELPFNRHTNLMTYIYKTFNHLNESISLEDFRYYGY